MVRASRAHFAHRVMVPYHCGPKVEDKKEAQGRLHPWPSHKFLAGCYVPKHSILVGFEKGLKRRPVQVIPGRC